MLLTEKWNKELVSEKYPSVNETDMAQMAMIMENAKAEETLLNERTDSADIAQFTPILVPLVRRVYPTLIANHLVGVQALKTPTAYLYALVYKYTNDSVNSIGASAKAQILTVGTAVAVGDVLVGATSTANGIVRYVEDGGLTALVEITNDILFEIESTTTTVTTVTATWSNEAQFQKVLTGYTGPLATDAAEDLTTNMKEVGFDIQRTLAESTSRKLKGKYTLEMYTDLKAMHGIDAEKEMVNLMGMELAWETDREVVNYVNDLANAASDVTISGYDGRWEVEKYRSLGIKIANEGRKVGQLVRKGSANTLLVTPKVSVALEAIGSFQISTTDVKIDAVNSGVNPSVGVFDKRFKTIVDNFSDGVTEYANVMYKGDSSKDAQAFLAPYSGATMVKTVDPENGNPAIILSSRYAIVSNPLTPGNYSSKFNVAFSGTALA